MFLYEHVANSFLIFAYRLFLDLNPANNHYYYLEKTTATFNSAISNAYKYPFFEVLFIERNDLRTAGRYLATITSESEHNFVINTFPGVSFWISGTDYYGQGIIVADNC